MTKRESSIKTGSGLARLRNVGPAMLRDFQALGITSVEQLVTEDATGLYLQLCAITGVRHDPCVEDVFAAAIHQARTGEALDWWAFSAARKARRDPEQAPKRQG